MQTISSNAVAGIERETVLVDLALQGVALTAPLHGACWNASWKSTGSRSKASPARRPER